MTKWKTSKVQANFLKCLHHSIKYDSSPSLHVMPTCLMVTCLHKYPELKSRMKMMEQTKKTWWKWQAKKQKKDPKNLHHPLIFSDSWLVMKRSLLDHTWDVFWIFAPKQPMFEKSYICKLKICLNKCVTKRGIAFQC